MEETLRSQLCNSFSKEALYVVGFCALTAPLERIKLILQTQGSTPYNSNLTRVSGGINTIKQVLVKEQGIPSFWKGNLLTTSYMLSRMTFFPIYLYTYKHYLKPKNEKSKISIAVSKLSSGVVSSLAVLSLMYPLDVMRTMRMTDLNNKYPSGFSVISKGLRMDGAATPFKAFSSSLVYFAIDRIPFFLPLFFILNSTLPKAVLMANTEEDKPDQETFNLLSLIAINTTLLIKELVSYPFDTVNKVLITQRKVEGKINYYGINDAMDKHIREGGRMALYRGFIPNIVRKSLGISLIFCYFNPPSGKLFGQWFNKEEYNYDNDQNRFN